MGSAEEAEKVLEGLGYTVTWDEYGVTEMVVPDPLTGQMITARVPNYRTVVTDGLQNTQEDNKTTNTTKSEPWENGYDKFYNTYEKINALLREREMLEKRYDRLLDKRNTRGSDLIANAKQ
jgi:hypothetical protein